MQRNKSIQKDLNNNDSQRIQQIIKLRQANSKWILRDIYINFQNCLTSTDKCRVFRGFLKQTAYDIIYKTIQISRKNLLLYQEIYLKAHQYYIVCKKYQLQQYRFENYYISIDNLPQEQSNSQVYFKFIRPYFKGRNFHEEVYIHNKFPYAEDQLHIFMKQALNILNADLGEAFYLPTLDNVYFDGVNLAINAMSFETLIFLKHKSSHLPVQNFRHLYPLLSSSVQTFKNWEKMQQYIKQKMKVKAFFCLLFCFITHRSPIEIITGQTITGEVLWQQLQKGNDKYSNLIQNVNKKWQKILDRIQNKRCLQHISVRIIQTYIKDPLKSLQISNLISENKVGQTFILKDEIDHFKNNYLINLYKRVFVQEQPFGWKQLFDQKYLFNYIIWFDQQQQQVKIKNDYQLNSLITNNDVSLAQISTQSSFAILQQLKKQQSTLDSFNITTYQNSYNQKDQDLKKQIKFTNQYICKIYKKLDKKIQAAKVSFIYLHKYFVMKQLKRNGIKDKEGIRKFVGKLHFQTFLPIRLGLPLQFTLSYRQWFQVFFNQSKDYRPQVYKAADYLRKIIENQSQEILRTTQGCNLAYLKRIQYLLNLKLEQNKASSVIQKLLIEQIQSSTFAKRPFEKTFQKLQKALKEKVTKDITDLYIDNVTTLLQKTYKQKQYPDLNPLIAKFIEWIYNKDNKHAWMQNQNSISKVLAEQPQRAKMAKNYIQDYTKKQSFVRILNKILDKIKGNVTIKQ